MEIKIALNVELETETFVNGNNEITIRQLDYMGGDEQLIHLTPKMAIAISKSLRALANAIKRGEYDKEDQDK